MKAKIMSSIFIFMISCGKPGDEVEPNRNLADLEKKAPKSAPVNAKNLCPSGTSLSYENFAANFLSKNCLSCHSQNLNKEQRAGAPLKLDLDTYELFLPFMNLIIPTLTGESGISMPPNRLLNLTEQKLMLEWLRCGAPY